jgi:hypothetical protein
MNEVQKAQELAWKVGISGMNMRGDIETNWDQLMDFAELIVKECANLPFKDTMEVTTIGEIAVSNMILKHFGVE